LWANPSNPYVWIVLGVTLAFGLVGFYDDYLKGHEAKSRRVRGRLRLLCRSGCRLRGLLCAHDARPAAVRDLAHLPFFKELVINLSWFFLIFGAFIIVGAGNAVNLTDGSTALRSGR
jgi:phospho-N-acetylmuramoyl-pentapeptide-transferase